MVRVPEFHYVSECVSDLGSILHIEVYVFIAEDELVVVDFSCRKLSIICMYFKLW